MLLTRLARAFERLTEPPVPVCAECGVPMVLRGEAPVGELPVALQRAYACSRCGHRMTSCVLWAIPD